MFTHCCKNKLVNQSLECITDFSQVGVSLKGSYMDMLSQVPMEDTEGMMLNETIKVNADTSMAGSEDCLHLAVFTPVVRGSWQKQKPWS